MSLREFVLVIEGRQERAKHESEAAWWRTAAMTADVVNMLGAINSTAKHPYKPRPPADYFNHWLGKIAAPPADLQERMERASEAAAARQRRDNTWKGVA